MPFNIMSSWKRRSKSLDSVNHWVRKPDMLWRLRDGEKSDGRKRECSLVFTLKEMQEATSSFCEQNLIGKGGFGRVFKGVLKNGEVVAVKKMDAPAFKRVDCEREFRVEVDILSRLDHPNLVTLIGYCADGGNKFVVYEYMPRGSLHDILNGSKEVKMEWSLRLKIALGAARGLAYLHSSSAVGVPVVHRDFKSSNILLNEHYEAKISDFGLAKLMQESPNLVETTRLLGTFGYFDPEYALTGKLTLQSDVYAFGIVLLELLTGRQAIELCQGPSNQNLILQVHRMLNDQKRLRKVIDQGMPKGSYTMESVSMFADLASRCVRMEGSSRPSMAECVKELKFIMYANMRV